MESTIDKTLIHIFINMRYYLLILITLLLTSCSSLQFRYGALNAVSQYDGIYYNKNTKVDIIDNDWDFARKLRNDWSFRQDFAWFAQNQDIGWYYRNYNYLGGWRSGVSPFDMWLNSNDIWWNWSVNYPFTYWNNFRTRNILGFGWGYSPWNDWGVYGYGSYWNSQLMIMNQNNNNYWRQRENRNRNRVVVNGRRGSRFNNQTETPRNNRVRNTPNVTTPRLRVDDIPTRTRTNTPRLRRDTRLRVAPNRNTRVRTNITTPRVRQSPPPPRRTTRVQSTSRVQTRTNNAKTNRKQ